MDNIGEQLHPNWLALATVHIPLKRFVKAGTEQVRNETRSSCQANMISGTTGDEIREFYEKEVTNEDNPVNIAKAARNNLTENYQKEQYHPKVPFEMKSYFRFALENKVDELKKMDFKGQNLNVCDNYGWSALMIASCEGAYEAVEFLIKLGVNKFIKDKSGRSAIDLACKRGHLKIVEALLSNLEELKNVTQEEKFETPQPFYCDICKQGFKETLKSEHDTSTVHQFNSKSTLPMNKLQKFNISSNNKGLQLMLKQGWDKGSGLGPSQSGRLYPIKTVIRKQRTGLGIEQNPACVTHFKAYDYKAVSRHNSNYYQKKSKNRNDIKREKIREWKQDRRLRNELN